MIDVDELVGTVFSGLSALVIEGIEDAGSLIVVRTETRDEPTACPGCGTLTGRVHGYHGRTAADVPVDGRRVVVKVKVRRPRCPVLDCPRQTFRGQVPGIPRCGPCWQSACPTLKCPVSWAEGPSPGTHMTSFHQGRSEYRPCGHQHMTSASVKRSRLSSG
jgi:transposase